MKAYDEMKHLGSGGIGDVCKRLKVLTDPVSRKSESAKFYTNTKK
jgi:hypothetical protein